MPDGPQQSRKRLGTLKTEPEDSTKLGGLQSPVRGTQQSEAAGGASTSGRGATAGGRGGGRKVKFAPKIPVRRKAAQASEAENAASVSGAAENEAFKDLIKAAKSEASWAKGGRGRGRGRGDGGRHHYQTTFGGGGSQHVFGQATGSGGGGISSGSGNKSWTKDGQPGSSGVAAGKQNLTPKELELLQAEGKVQREPEVTLNYEQYYPTLLPMRQPGMEETDAEAHARDDRPPDLSLHQERVTDAAADLGLLDLEADPDRLLLLQLPSLLPVPASSLPSHQRPGQPIKRLGQPEACSLNQLPSGKIGKLLVFESGAVKLQMGEVLLDVTAGTPCQFRQEVAAVNAKDAHFIFLGDVAQRIVCSPNIGQLINDEPIPDWPRAIQQPGPSLHKQANKGKGTADPRPTGNDFDHAVKDEDMPDADHQVKKEEELVDDVSSPTNRNAALMDEDESE